MIGGLAPYHYEQASREQPRVKQVVVGFTIRTSHSYSSCLKCARRSVMQQLQLKMMDDETQIIIIIIAKT